MECFQLSPADLKSASHDEPPLSRSSAIRGFKEACLYSWLMVLLLHAGPATMAGCDPLASWYAHHYGRGLAAAQQAAANAQAAADMAEGAAAAAVAQRDAQQQQVCALPVLPWKS